MGYMSFPLSSYSCISPAEPARATRVTRRAGSRAAALRRYELASLASRRWSSRRCHWGCPRRHRRDAPPEITRTPHDEPLISYSTVSVLALPSEGSPNHDGRCSSRFTIQNLPRAACTRACSESVTSKAPRPFLMPPGWPYCALTMLMSGRAAPPLISKSSFSRPAKLPSHVETVPRLPFKMYLTITTLRWPGAGSLPLLSVLLRSSVRSKNNDSRADFSQSASSAAVQSTACEASLG